MSGLSESVRDIAILLIEEGFLLFFLPCFEVAILCLLMMIVGPFSSLGSQRDGAGAHWD